jgi:predicted nucleic acid-binding protein
VILDTDAISALADGDPALHPVLTQASRTAIPVIALGEYRYGILHSRDRARYEKWLAEYLHHFQILEIDETTTIAHSVIRSELRKAGTPIPSNDAWIAALGRQHSFAILSRDHHFDFVHGSNRVDW